MNKLRTMTKMKKTKDKAGLKGLGFDSEQAELPEGIESCFDFLYGHLEAEGLFRLSASISKVQALRSQLDKGEVPDLSLYALDPHAVAGTLKGFLRELPDPVCPSELYDCFLAAAAVQLQETRVSCIKKLLALLPPGNAALLKRLCKLLGAVSEKSEMNKMSPKNLAIVFAPTLLRPKTETMDEMMRDQEMTHALVQFFITEYDFIFEDRAVPHDSSSAPSSASPDEDSARAGPRSATLSGNPPFRALRSLAEMPKFRSARPLNLALVIWDFIPQHPDELEVRAGTVVIVETRSSPDGGSDFWSCSDLLASSKKGLVQSSFLAPLPPTVTVGSATQSYESDKHTILSFKKDDIFLFDGPARPDGWWEADHVISNEHGLVHSSLIQTLYKKPDSPSALLSRQTRQFYQRLSRVDLSKVAQQALQLAITENEPVTDNPPIATAPSASESPSIELSASESLQTNTSESSPCDDDSSHSTPIDLDDQQAETGEPIPEHYPDQEYALSEDLASDNSDSMTSMPDVSTDFTPSVEPEFGADDSNFNAESSVEPENADENSSAIPEYVVAIYDYTATPGTPELSFQQGDRLLVVQHFGSGWMEAELNGNVGFIPRNYVEPITDI